MSFPNQAAVPAGLGGAIWSHPKPSIIPTYTQSGTGTEYGSVTSRAAIFSPGLSFPISKMEGMEKVI